MNKIIIFGNSGSGKSTMAKKLKDELFITHLDLDIVAWNEPGIRKDIEESKKLILNFVQENNEWIIEGTYGSLIEYSSDFADEMIFLNPGIEICISNCESRPWEEHKYSSPEAQNKNLEMLKGWVSSYYTRNDEYSYNSHKIIYEKFKGKKKEFTANNYK